MAAVSIGSQPSPTANRVAALAAEIAGSGASIEAEGRLPEALVARLAEAGLYHMLLPSWLGGDELLPGEFAATVENIARIDASTAWCVVQACSCSMVAAALPRDAAQAVFASRRDLIAWGPPRDARAVDIGRAYRVTGTWMFASGGHNATWLGGHCPVFEAGGAPRLGPGGSQVVRTMLFPRAAARLTGAWNVIGLRGTGSHMYEIADHEVPHAYSVDRELPACAEPEGGIVHRLTPNQISAVGFAAVALGVARGALDSYMTLAAAKTPRGELRRLRDSGVIQSQLAWSEAKLRSARALLFATLHEIPTVLADADRLGLQPATDLRLASTFAMHVAADVVQFAYRTAGADAIFDDHPLQRRFRDINTLVQQVQARYSHFETVGRVLFGLEADTTFF